MPTYDYQCPAGHNFEKIHKMSETPRVKCPVCGKPAARQISGGAGLVFKGSGFYITDYGKDGKGAAEGRGGRRRRRRRRPAAMPARRRPPSREAGAEGRQGVGAEVLRRIEEGGRVSDGAAAGARARRHASWAPADADFVLERPRDAGHGDLATNLAMVLARVQKAPPRAVAARIIEALDLPPGVVEKTEIAGPGFINFWLADATRSRPRSARILAEAGPRYGRHDFGRGRPGQRRVRLRQPDRPAARGARPGRARWATASRRCSSGPATSVTREFYINDAGRADRPAWAQSLWARVQEAVGRAGRRSPRAAITASTSARTRRGAGAGGAGVRRPARGGGRPAVPGARARHPAGGAGPRPRRASASGSTS